MRFRRLLRYWPALAVLATALVIYLAWPGRWTFTVSPETTYVTEPVDANGYVDYPTALNERLRKGITPETNANVLIWQAIGPRPEGGTMPPEFFRWLGVPPPPDEGEYFVRWDKYVTANLKTPPDDVLGLFDDPREWRQLWDDRLSRLRAWPWRFADEPHVADWLKRNEKPLAVAIEASKRPEYFNPLVSTKSDPASARLIGSLLPGVQSCRGIALALACRAMARLAAGDPDGAWQDLLAGQRLGRLLTRGATMIETLVGIAVSAMVTSSQLTLLDHGSHPPERLRSWLADLRALPPARPMAEKLDLGERFVTLDALTSVIASPEQGMAALAGGPGSGKGPHFTDRLFTRSIDWDPGFRKVNRTYDRMVAAARLPDRAARKAEFASISDEFDQRVRTNARKNIFGRLASSKGERGEAIVNILLGLTLPALDKLQDSEDRAEQTRRNLVVAAALALHKAETGRYPARPEELAPKYLPQVPGDLFAGKPLVYRPTESGYVLYSVGVNGVDEDGRWLDDDPRGDDPRVRMPVPEPRQKRTD